MVRQLGVSASREHRHHRPPRYQRMRFTKLLAVFRCFYLAHQRMTDEFRGNPRVTEEIFLKCKNAKGFFEAPADQVHPPRPPRPELGANVVDVADPLRLQLSC